MVAELDGEVGGYCDVAAPGRDPDNDDHTAEIASISVAPARWRSGVGGSLLLSAALGDLGERG